jgi:hypothetical protein
MFHEFASNRESVASPLFKMGNVADATQVRARYLELLRDSLIGLIDEDPALEIRPRAAAFRSTPPSASRARTGRPARCR